MSESKMTAANIHRYLSEAAHLPDPTDELIESCTATLAALRKFGPLLPPADLAAAINAATDLKDGDLPLHNRNRLATVVSMVLDLRRAGYPLDEFVQALCFGEYLCAGDLKTSFDHLPAETVDGLGALYEHLEHEGVPNFWELVTPLMAAANALAKAGIEPLDLARALTGQQFSFKGIRPSVHRLH